MVLIMLYACVDCVVIYSYLQTKSVLKFFFWLLWSKDHNPIDVANAQFSSYFFLYLFRSKNVYFHLFCCLFVWFFCFIRIWQRQKLKKLSLFMCYLQVSNPFFPFRSRAIFSIAYNLLFSGFNFSLPFTHSLFVFTQSEDWKSFCIRN